MFTVPPTTYSNDGWATASNQAFPAAVALTGSSVTASGSTQVTLASVAGVAQGQSVGLNLSSVGAIAPGSIVSSINNGTSVITLSIATTAAIPASTKLYFGVASQASSPLEVQRAAYNTYLRSNWRLVSCFGLIDIDGAVADQVNLGKWRTDLGQPSVDGVHPSAALHQAAVAAGMITPGMLGVP